MTPKKDFVSRSNLGKVFRSGGSHHTPVQPALNHLGCRRWDSKLRVGGRPIIQLRAKPCEVIPHVTDPLVDYGRTVVVFAA